MQITGNLSRRRVGATPQFESTDVATALCGTIAERTAVDDCSGGVQQLSTRTDIDVALPVEDEIGAAEGAIGACRLVPDRDVRGYLTVHQPLEQPDRTISGVGCEPLWSKLEAPPDPVQHGPRDGDLNNPVGARALGVDDDPGFVVDEIVGVVSEKWIGILPRNPCRLRIGQRHFFRRLASAAPIEFVVIFAVLPAVLGGI